MPELPKTVLYEEEMDHELMEVIHRIPGGQKIKTCIQCGTCSGTCPVSWGMEHTPRQVFAMIRAGMKDAVLDSTTIWTCASCYKCSVRCPQGIKITDIMYALKRMAIQENRQRSKKAQALSRQFVKVVNRYGRNHEAELMTRFLLATRPFSAPRESGIGWKLFKSGRLPLRHETIEGIDGLRKIVKKAQELGGEQ